MKKSLAILLAAVALLALVLGIKNYREGAPRRREFVFDTTAAAEVADLRVRYLHDSVYLIAAHGGWLTTGDSFPVDTAVLRKTLGTLLGIRTHEKVSDSMPETELAEYGLDSGEAKRVDWTWRSGGKVHILLGKTSAADYGYVYWKWRDAPAVYRTPGNFIWEINPRVSAWKAHAFWPAFTPEDMRFLEVEWRSPADSLVSYRIERSGNAAFRLTGPLDAPASQAAAAKLFENAARLTADDFGLELDPDSGKVSLERPAITVRIGLKDGTLHVLRAGKAFNGYQYTQHPSHRNKVWVFKWRYDSFRKMPADLVERTPGGS